MPETGKVYLVGAGPGDPGLLTLKGKAILERADCVVYDSLVNPDLISLAPKGAFCILVSKTEGEPATTQKEIHRLLVDRARHGMTVVRLKGGDPFIFGRGGEEAEALTRAGIPWEVVPGVSAGHGVPAYAGIPLTHRAYSSSVAFLTGHEDPSKHPTAVDWGKISTGINTLVFLMGAGKLAEIVSSLIAHGRKRETPATVIRWGTKPEQEVVRGTLADIAGKASGMDSPIIIVVGEVAALGKELNWYEQLPLFGRQIMITRARGQARMLADQLTERGAQVIEFPTIEIRKPETWAALDSAVRQIKNYHYLLVTSVHGVENFFARLKARGGDTRVLGNLKIGAIGPGTAGALEMHGVRPDFVPKEYAAEGLLEALRGVRLKGKRFLIPRARVARDMLPNVLRKRGAKVDVVEAYVTVSPSQGAETVKRLFARKPSMITFTSSSTAKNFVKLTGQSEAQKLLESVAVAAIGPITSATLKELGLPPDVEATEYTMPGLVRAIERHFSARKERKRTGGGRKEASTN